MAATMKAIVKERPGPGLTMTTVPMPSPGRGEVLVKVRTVSICGTDYHVYEWNKWAESRIKPPLIAGHELAGEVVQLGEDVDCVKIGDFVSAESHIVCGTCPQCMMGQAQVCANTTILGVDIPGCFSEYVVLPQGNLWLNDDSLPDDWASVQEPMGNAVYSVLSGEVAGRTVAITGAGPIGMMCILIAKAVGARSVAVTEVNEYRLDMARKLGADLVIDASQQDPVLEVRKFFGGGADVVLEMAGAGPAVIQALKMARSGGRVSLLGIPSDKVLLDVTNDLVFKGLTVYGIAGRKLWNTWHEVAGLLHSGSVDLSKVITHRLPWEDFEYGMELMGQGKSGKIVLDVSEE